MKNNPPEMNAIDFVREYNRIIRRSEGMTAGSLKSIAYEGLQFVDEILHATIFDWLVGEAHWRHRFCQWTHRYDE